MSSVHVEPVIAGAARETWLGGSLKAFREDPLALLCELHRASGDVAKFRLGPKKLYAVFNPDMLKEIMVTKAEAFCKGGTFAEIKRLTGEGLVLSEGELHKKQRRLIQPKLTRSHINRYAEQMVASTLAHLETWGDGQERDLAVDMMKITFDIIARTMFSYDSKHAQDQIARAFDSINHIATRKIRALVKLPLFIPTNENREYIQALRVLDDTVYGLIRQRKAESSLEREDLLSVLMRATDESSQEGMSDEQLRDEIMSMFLAGHETTAHSLTWTYDYILQNPNVEEKLMNEWKHVLNGRRPTVNDYPALTYTQNVIWETLRLRPSGYVTSRTALQDVEIGSLQLIKGDTVMISPYPLHTSERYFDDPLTFRPERFEQDRMKELPQMAYFPFGAGPRSCVGQHFAMLEMVLILASIGQQYRIKRSSTQGALIPEALLTLSPKGGLRATVHRL